MVFPGEKQSGGKEYNVKKRLWLRPIAVAMTMVLFLTMSGPAFAATETKAVETQSVTTVVQGTKKKTIFIGDSRTANLRQVRNNGKLIYDLLQQDGSVLWDFKWGATFVDLTTTLIPRLEMSGLDTIDNKTKIGAKVYVMNVGPAGRMPGASGKQKQGYTDRNKVIRTFNEKLSVSLLPQIKYIDCYGYLKDTGFGTTDGTHYNAATSKKIYSFTINAIK